MLRPEDVEQPELKEQKQSTGISGLMKGIFGGGGSTDQPITTEAEATATRIAEQSKDGRGSVTTSTVSGSSETVHSTNTYSVETKDSDEKWDRARALTAQAQEQGRIAQTKTVEASATQREASEAMRRAEVARGAEQELQGKLRDINPEVGEAEYKKTSEKYALAKKVTAGKRSELERLERELAQLDDDVNRKVAFLQGQVDATKSAKANLDDIDSKIARIKKHVGEEEAEAASNRADADKLKGDIASLQAATKTEQATFDKAQLRVKELLQQLEEAKRTADSARAKLAGAEHKIEDIEGKLSDYDDAVKHHISEANSLKSKIPDLEKAKAASLALLKGAQSKLDVASKDAKAKTDTLEDREALARSLKDTLSKTQEQAKVKAAEVARKKADFEQAQADLKPLQAERQRQRTIVTSEEKNFKELEIKYKSSQVEADRAQAKKEELWEAAKVAGEQADNIVDESYVKLGGDASLTEQNEKTARVASQTGGKETTKGEYTAVAPHQIAQKVEK